MKELSNEDKAKRYDEALHKAKRIINVCVDDNTECRSMIACIQQIFPELKESEDERILKQLRDFFKNHINSVYEEIDDNNDVLTWLEKQGECEFDCPQNHQDVNRPNGCIVLEDFNGGEGFYKVHLDYLNKKQVEEIEEMIRVWNNKELKTPNENIKDCIGICLTDANEQRFKDFNTNLKECLVWLKKQGEQKLPIEKLPSEVKTPEESLGIDSNTYNKIVDECVYGEQKPAWSEEDKERFESCIKVLQTSDGYDTINAKWLKSLKDRVLPKSTWNEEDDEHLERILKELGNQRQRSINSPYLDKIESDYNWLKSIKDRVGCEVNCTTTKEWKPSDEQMDALQYVYRNCNPLPSDKLGWDSIRTLELMYQDLKKLREE